MSERKVIGGIVLSMFVCLSIFVISWRVSEAQQKPEAIGAVAAYEIGTNTPGIPTPSNPPPTRYPSQTPEPLPTRTQAVEIRYVERKVVETKIVKVYVVTVVTATPRPDTPTPYLSPTPDYTAAALAVAQDIEKTDALKYKAVVIGSMVVFGISLFIAGRYAIIMAFDHARERLSLPEPVTEIIDKPRPPERNLPTISEVYEIDKLRRDNPEIADNITAIQKIVFKSGPGGSDFYKTKDILDYLDRNHLPTSPDPLS